VEAGEGFLAEGKGDKEGHFPTVFRENMALKTPLFQTSGL
jgi:hypothetical protein